MVNRLLVKAYAVNVYFAGTKTLAEIEAMRPEYVIPVEQYAADTFYIEEIDSALVEGWITPDEHAETLALKGPEDPQNRPEILMMEIPAE